MRDVAWRLSFTLTALAVLAIFAPSAGCAFGNRLVEELTGQTPQAQIADYLEAIARSDRQAAFSLWSSGAQIDSELAFRRETVTDELLAYGSHLEYRLVDVEWWRACCEPGVIDDPVNAGAARVQVAISGENSAEVVYVFDVLVPGGYWGEAVGNPVRRWEIADVYRKGETPLVWIWQE